MFLISAVLSYLSTKTSPEANIITITEVFHYHNKVIYLS